MHIKFHFIALLILCLPSCTIEKESITIKHNPNINLSLLNQIQQIGEESISDPNSKYNITFVAGTEDDYDIGFSDDGINASNYKSFNPNAFTSTDYINTLNAFIVSKKNCLPISFMPNIGVFNNHLKSEDSFTSINDLIYTPDVYLQPECMISYFLNDEALGENPICLDINNRYVSLINGNELNKLKEMNAVFRSLPLIDVDSSGMLPNNICYTITNSTTLTVNTMSPVEGTDFRLIKVLDLNLENITISPTFSALPICLYQNKVSSLSEQVIKYVYNKLLEKTNPSLNNGYSYPVLKEEYLKDDATKCNKDMYQYINDDYLTFYKIENNIVEAGLYRLFDAVINYEENENHTFDDYINYIVDQLNNNEYINTYYQFIND